jgi:hypothetical protein
MIIAMRISNPACNGLHGLISQKIDKSCTQITWNMFLMKLTVVLITKFINIKNIKISTTNERQELGKVKTINKVLYENKPRG